MNMQFTRDCKNTFLFTPNGIRRRMFLCILFLSSLVVKAQQPQLMPVGVQFSGEWLFYNAQAQERPSKSKQSYSVRTVSQDEFWQKTYFLNMPTQLDFEGNGFLAFLYHPSWSQQVIAGINQTDGKLEFRTFFDPENPDKKADLSKINFYETRQPVYDLALNGNVMSLQCDYFYSDGKGNNIEGILTIYYKK